MIDRKDIEKLGLLARIPITGDEEEKLAAEIDRILAYVSEMGQVAESEPPLDVSDTYNVLREDTDAHESSIYTDALLAEVPRREGNYVKVKRILG